MAFTVTPRDIKFLHLKLNITSDTFAKLYEASTKMNIWQAGKYGEYLIEKKIACNCLLTKEAFWKGAIKAVYSGEERVKIEYSEDEYVIFRVEDNTT